MRVATPAKLSTFIVTKLSHLLNHFRRFREIPLGIDLRYVRGRVAQHYLRAFQTEPLA
jgi:hypothetical protein